MGTSKQDSLPEFHEVSVIAVGDSYYVEHDKDTNQAYSLRPADWRSKSVQTITLAGNALSTLERGGAIAYNKCYIWDFGGYR